ncbi:MAG: septum formation initiator family protein [Bryobacterales bacterium]|nr:septum formation initiator family protein [Bryobacterales bacterium]
MSFLRTIGVVGVVALSSAYIFMALRGPQGLSSLEEKWHEIRELQQQNADLRRAVELRTERIKKLQESPSEQELEIRKRLKLMRKGETTFITPETAEPETK